MLDTTDNTLNEFFAAIMRNLPHMTDAERKKCLADESGMRAVLAGLIPPRDAADLPVSRVIVLGMRDGREAYEQVFAAEGSGFEILPWAKAMTEKVVVHEHEDEIEVKIGIVTAQSLGCEKAASLKNIYAAAKRRGYERLTGEMALALRDQYAEQPGGDWLYVAMPSILAKQYGRGIFMLTVSGGRKKLKGVKGTLKEEFHPASPFAFVIP